MEGRWNLERCKRRASLANRSRGEGEWTGAGKRIPGGGGTPLLGVNKWRGNTDMGEIHG
jgi:hypothetical protein